MYEELIQVLCEMMIITWVLVLFVFRKRFRSKIVFYPVLICGILFIWFYPFEQLIRHDTLSEAHSDYKISVDIEDEGRAEKAIIGSDIAVVCYEWEGYIGISNYPPYYNNGHGWKTTRNLFVLADKVYTIPNYCIAHIITVPRSNECIIIVTRLQLEWLLKHQQFDEEYLSRLEQMPDVFGVSDTIGTEFKPLFFDEDEQINSYYAILQKSKMQDYKIFVSGFEITVEKKYKHITSR